MPGNLETTSPISKRLCPDLISHPSTMNTHVDSKPAEVYHHEIDQLPAHHTIHTGVQTGHLFVEDEQGRVIRRILIPRPTDDPKDPLTWAPWRKTLAMSSVSLFVFLSNYTMSSMAPCLLAVEEEFGSTATQVSYLISLNILVLGLGNLFWIPISRKYGKRPIIVLCSCLYFVACIWGGTAQTFGSLLGSRIVQGFGASASEALGPSVVADLYFLHERATMTSFYTFMIGGGSALGGIFGGLVINGSSNWRWVMWMNAILTGVCFLMNFLFAQETNFLRPDEAEATEVELSEVPHVQTKYSLSSALSFTGWYDRSTSLGRYFWRPLPLLLYPGVLWAALIYGVTLGWVMIQQTANAIYFPAFYSFSALGVGNLYIANFVGAIFGCLAAGPLNDWVTQRITKRANGYFKPEYRLWLMISPIIFGPVGLALWGCGLGKQLHWSVPMVGSGISYAVLCAVPNIGMTYVVDAYTEVAAETMTSLQAFKNTFAFGLSFGVIPWVNKTGFVALCGYEILIEMVLFLLTVPLYIWGERIRRWTATFAL